MENLDDSSFFDNEITLGQLFEYAKKHNLMDAKICVQYRDDGGEYGGCDEHIYGVVEEDKWTGEKFFIM